MFKTLFGTEPYSIKETCIVIPFMSKEIINEFKVGTISKGLLYSSGGNSDLSVIIARMGAGFTGDAVLHLKDTPCKNILFFGSCGAIRDSLKAGSIIAIEKSISQESFIGMLKNRPPYDDLYPDKSLCDAICKNAKTGILRGVCLTAGSLSLEKEYIGTLTDYKIDVVDMETAAVFSAAHHTGKKSAAVLFVTDNIYNNPYYTAFDKYNSVKIKGIARNSAKAVYKIACSIL